MWKSLELVLLQAQEIQNSILSELGLIPSLPQSFIQQIFITYWVSGTVLGAGIHQLRNKDKNLCLHGAVILVKEDTQGTVKIVNMYTKY